MAFIFEQEAQFAVNTQRLLKDRLCDSPRQRQFGMLVHLPENTNTRFDRLESNMDILQSNMAALAAAQAQNAERLSALINILGEDPNGKS